MQVRCGVKTSQYGRSSVAATLRFSIVSVNWLPILIVRLILLLPTVTACTFPTTSPNAASIFDRLLREDTTPLAQVSFQGVAREPTVQVPRKSPFSFGDLYGTFLPISSLSSSP